jgi:hypothetical protein
MLQRRSWHSLRLGRIFNFVLKVFGRQGLRNHQETIKVELVLPPPDRHSALASFNLSVALGAPHYMRTNAGFRREGPGRHPANSLEVYLCASKKGLKKDSLAGWILPPIGAT